MVVSSLAKKGMSFTQRTPNVKFLNAETPFMPSIAVHPEKLVVQQKKLKRERKKEGEEKGV